MQYAVFKSIRVPVQSTCRLSARYSLLPVLLSPDWICPSSWCAWEDERVGLPVPVPQRTFNTSRTTYRIRYSIYYGSTVLVRVYGYLWTTGTCTEKVPTVKPCLIFGIVWLVIGNAVGILVIGKLVLSTYRYVVVYAGIQMCRYSVRVRYLYLYQYNYGIPVQQYKFAN